MRRPSPASRRWRASGVTGTRRCRRSRRSCASRGALRPAGGAAPATKTSANRRRRSRTRSVGSTSRPARGRRSYTDLRAKRLVDRERETSRQDIAQLRQELPDDAGRDARREPARVDLEGAHAAVERGAAQRASGTDRQAADGERAMTLASPCDPVDGEGRGGRARPAEADDGALADRGPLRGELTADRPAARDADRTDDPGDPQDMDPDRRDGPHGGRGLRRNLELKVDELRREIKDELRRLSDDHSDRTRDLRQRLEDRIGQQEQVWGIMARGLAEMRNRRLRDSASDRDDDLAPRDDELDDEAEAPPRRRRSRLSVARGENAYPCLGAPKLQCPRTTIAIARSAARSSSRGTRSAAPRAARRWRRTSGRARTRCT